MAETPRLRGPVLLVTTAAVSRWEGRIGTCLVLSCEFCLGAAFGGGVLVFFCFDQDRSTSAEVG